MDRARPPGRLAADDHGPADGNTPVAQSLTASAPVASTGHLPTPAFEPRDERLMVLRDGISTSPALRAALRGALLASVVGCGNYDKSVILIVTRNSDLSTELPSTGVQHEFFEYRSDECGIGRSIRARA